jgi:hypothetical protein
MYVRGAWYGTCSTLMVRLLLPLSCAPNDTVTMGKPLQQHTCQQHQSEQQTSAHWADFA